MLNSTVEAPHVPTAAPAQPKSDALLTATYGASLLASVSVWFLAVRAPLWTDETLSYWQIAGGFKQVWARSIQGNSFAAYAYVLWLTKSIFGANEIVLRIPSILAMLAATYVFYRCARELFDWDVSLIAATLFVLVRGIAFAAIDVRPYAFALLVTTLTVLMFLRWMKTGKVEFAALFGAAAGSIFYFHYLFSSILGALGIWYVISRRRFLRSDLRQIGVALGCFAAVLLPVLPRLRYIYQTRAAHSFAPLPHLVDTLQYVNLGKWPLILMASVFVVAMLTHTLVTPGRKALRKFAFCALLGLFPIAFLYGISVGTSVHVFISRYLLVAVPGVTLSWVWFCSLIDSKIVRALFCFAFVALCTIQAYHSPVARMHEDSWKRVLAFADQNAAEDRALLVICSPLVEADYEPMPDVASESVLFAPLSYYKVGATVVPLPRTFNETTARDVDQFLLNVTPERRRFLALVPWPSLRILDYMATSAAASYSVRVLGRIDDVWVVEFAPTSPLR